MGSNIVRLEQEVFFVGVGDPNYVILPSDKSTPRLEERNPTKHRKQGHSSRPAFEIGLPCSIHPFESRRTCHVGGVHYVGDSPSCRDRSLASRIDSLLAASILSRSREDFFFEFNIYSAVCLSNIIDTRHAEVDIT